MKKKENKLQKERRNIVIKGKAKITRVLLYAKIQKQTKKAIRVLNVCTYFLFLAMMMIQTH